jgi:hypothetical protein
VKYAVISDIKTLSPQRPFLYRKFSANFKSKSDGSPRVSLRGPDFSNVIGNGPKTGLKPKAEKPAGKKPKATKSTQSKSKTSQAESPAKSTSQDDQIKLTTVAIPQEIVPRRGNGNDGSKTQASGKQPAVSEAQKRALYNLSRRRGISVAELEQMPIDAYDSQLKT